jgi:hypothetical protein
MRVNPLMAPERTLRPTGLDEIAMQSNHRAIDSTWQPQVEWVRDDGIARVFPLTHAYNPPY